MILPSQEIKRLSEVAVASLGLVSPFVGANLRASSYDLTVGEEYYIGQDGLSSKLLTQSLKNSQTFTIPPHAICFILSAETIRLPNDVTAKVSLRMTHIYAGMVLTSQPPFDPGYCGRVVVLLHNLSSEPCYIKSGERVATIEFMRLEAASVTSNVHRSVKTLEEQLSKPLVSSLTEIAGMSTSAHDRVAWLSNQMLVFAALVVAVLAVPGFFSYSSLLDRLGDNKEQIKEMSQTMEGYKRDLENNRRAIDELEKRFPALNKKTAVSSDNSAVEDLGSRRP
ncbi:MAG: hypothetical protein EON54_10495 [Alcaligenaceae bacterium]|nr:MAG: hypothetical protein EON54_10495 [Alcaligenaceae bacterium]